jgi:hypothetical protein
LVLRKVCLLFGLVLIASMAARAQEAGDKIELFGGYAYMHFKSTPAANLNGFDLAGQYKVGDWFGLKLGVVADIGGEYGKVNGVSSQVYTYIFGPQISWPHRISPFVHVLGGLGHFSGGNFTSRGLAYGIGGGVDYKISRRLNWRIIQADVLPTHLGSNDQHSARVSTGIVFHF